MEVFIDTNTQTVDDFLYKTYGGISFEDMGFKKGSIVVFKGFPRSNDGEVHTHWCYTKDSHYRVIRNSDTGKLTIPDDEGDSPSRNWGFVFELVKE